MVLVLGERKCQYFQGKRSKCGQEGRDVPSTGSTGPKLMKLHGFKKHLVAAAIWPKRCFWGGARCRFCEKTIRRVAKVRQRKRQGPFGPKKFVLVYFFVIGPWKYCFFWCQEQKTIKSQQRFGQAFFFLLPMQRGSAKNEIASKRKQAKPCSAGCFLIEEAKLSWLAGLAGMAGLAGLAGLAELGQSQSQG